jgi:hypothetical protein
MLRNLSHMQKNAMDVPTVPAKDYRIDSIDHLAPSSAFRETDFGNAARWKRLPAAPRNRRGRRRKHSYWIPGAELNGLQLVEKGR